MGYAQRMPQPSLAISLLLAAASLGPEVRPAQALLAQATPAAAPGAQALPGRSGVVTVEQGGRAVALGTLLNGDGRVLTALSRLSAERPTFIRYEGGRLEAARIGSSDATRDLALLVPSTARVRVGVKASRNPQVLTNQPLHSFTLQANRSLVPLQQTLVVPRAGAANGLAELGARAKPGDAGGPLLTAGGEAVAILVGGCTGGQAQAVCENPPLALPLTEVRAFLRELPVTAALSVPWLGARGRAARPSDRGLVPGVLVIRLDPGSPAADRSQGQPARAPAARPDVIVAVSGEPTPSPEALRAALSSYAPGERIELLLFNGRYRVQPLRVAAPPGPKAKVFPRLAPTNKASSPPTVAPVPTPAAPAAEPVKSP
jgi:S1-C subfamily serine protease